MAAKAKRNGALPKPAAIGFSCDRSFRRLAHTIVSGEDGRFSLYVGIRQPSLRVYPYQVQYRVKSRYAETPGRKKGASWTNWSAWKNAREFSWITIDAKKAKKRHTVKLGSGKDVSSWGRANVGINRKGTWKTVGKMQVAAIGDAYTARKYEFRARCFCASKGTAGEWAYATLTVHRRPKVQDEALVAQHDGALWIGANITPNRGGRLHITDLLAYDPVRKSYTRSLLRDAHGFSCAWALDSDRTQASVPPLRAGLMPAEARIPLSKMKDAVRPGQHLRIKGYYQASDGVRTWLWDSSSLHKVTVSPWEGALDSFRMTVLDGASGRGHAGMAVVRCYRTQESADDLYSDAHIRMRWRYHGKAYSEAPAIMIKSLRKGGAGACFAKAVFNQPPIGIPYWFEATVHNSAAGRNCSRTLRCTQRTQRSGTVWIVRKRIEHEGGDRYSPRYMTFAGNASIEPDTESVSTVELPYGRDLPFAAFGRGMRNKITVSGTVYGEWARRSNERSAPPHCTWEDADALRTGMGLWYVLSPMGDRYLTAVQEVSANWSDGGKVGVTVTAQEVR